MADMWHLMGGDLTLAANGDLLMASNSDETRQRVLRRLLTNPGDYLWALEYGAGLPGFVGQPINKEHIAAISRAQMLLEAGVAQNPPPTVVVNVADPTTVSETITYTDAPTRQVAVLTVPIG